MATILTVSASPSPTSKSAATRRLVDAHLAGLGHHVHPLDARELPPAALLGADTGHPAIAAALDLFARADGVVVVTPVYKAAYSGLLKTLLDLLPQSGLARKVVLPLATGGTTAHVLAIDYALRPVLSSLGSAQIVQGYFVLEQDITREPDGGAVLAADSAAGLTRAVSRFAEALALHHGAGFAPAEGYALSAA
ncbi:NADPH-dependent FMN reductase [Actinospica durhamensis]|uniref:NADPH-dependent FMN reductase n=1 Tax=Actinospica durhamensis TaxID=1508375 RepID=A0A941ITZ5_9ACTN|nr:NADPH-dependent FMN reductase [Actinospica durhamensis]MBR7836653.1 NADPH-dependent FMN reductase [Actinospica durhamensis]